MGTKEDSKINLNGILKKECAKIISPIKEIKEPGGDYIAVGNPILFIPEAGLENITYITGRYASRNRLNIEDIVAYSKVENEEIKELKKTRDGKGYGLQFYTNKDRLRKVLMNYKQSRIKVYEM